MEEKNDLDKCLDVVKLGESRKMALLREVVEGAIANKPITEGPEVQNALRMLKKSEEEGQ